ncbi:hypothetical protein OG589_40500 [Sphaerisporangium sp. NBC_01403]|uniref:hypothetical protein n=1 Tax=Sphaerisporangium sp. NBC_01403 TaxID=2903599 RepID=UPI0032482028
MLSSTAAVTVHMQWRGDVRGGDWVGLQTPPGKMPAPRFAELDTQEFDTEGWTAIRPGG